MTDNSKESAPQDAQPTPRTAEFERGYESGNDWAEYRRAVRFAEQLERDLVAKSAELAAAKRIRDGLETDLVVLRAQLAVERERCAKVCDDYAKALRDQAETCWQRSEGNSAADYDSKAACAESIAIAIRSLPAQAEAKGEAVDVGEPLFYLQDKRSYVGNDVLWWQKGGGYTTDVSKAETFTKEKAEAQHRMRETDIPWPKQYIDSKTRPAVDMQYINLEAARAQGRGEDE